jgi:hypothetical protein
LLQIFADVSTHLFHVWVLHRQIFGAAIVCTADFYSTYSLIAYTLTHFFQKPLALAKILGVYSIGFKNSKTGSSKRMDVVVMENLLYGRNFSQVSHGYILIVT